MLNRNPAKSQARKKGRPFFDLPRHDESNLSCALGNSAGSDVDSRRAVTGDAVRHRVNGDTVQCVRQLLAEAVYLHERTLPIALQGGGKSCTGCFPSVGRFVVEYLRHHGGDIQRFVVDDEEHGHTLQLAAGSVVEVVGLIHGIELDRDGQRDGEISLAECNAGDGHLTVGQLDFFVVHRHGGRGFSRDNLLIDGDSYPREDVARRYAAVRISTETYGKDARECAAKVANDRHFLAADLLAFSVGVSDVGHVDARELLAAANVADEVTEFAAGAADNEIVFHGTLNLRVKRFILLYIDTRAYRNTRL